MSLPAQLGPLKRFLVQANRIQKVNPLVAYYCRLHVMTKLLNIPKAERETAVNVFLGDMMDRLEQDSSGLQLSKPNDGLLLLGFADHVFKVADDQDRGGKASLETCQAFMTCFCVYEVLETFGEVFEREEVQQRIKYARWRAVEIKRALDEGRDPRPAVGAEEEEHEEGIVDEQAEEKVAQVSDEEELQPLREAKEKKQKEEVARKEKLAVRKKRGLKRASVKDLAVLNKAEELTRTALSAIRFNDTLMGIEQLKKALETLESLH